MAASGVSRRTLENLFRAELSSSIAETIRNARLDRLASRLRESDSSISHICGECGWAHPSHAMRLFKIRFGLTMDEWRKNEKRNNRG